MKGIMFEVLSAVTEADGGPDLWDAVLDDAGVLGAYTSLGTYDDAEFVSLIVALAERRGEPVPDTIRWFGRAALPILVDRYPVFVADHRTTATFLMTLNDVIHPEVRKVYPGASVPDFVVLPRPDGSAALEYRSPRALCTLAEGLILGASDHFGEVVEVTQSACVHRGDECCVLEISGLLADPR